VIFPQDFEGNSTLSSPNTLDFEGSGTSKLVSILQNIEIITRVTFTREFKTAGVIHSLINHLISRGDSR
jgi:hypothetical protein